jgi:serine/threonine-protein kinase
MEYIDGVTLEQFSLQHRDMGRPIPFEIGVFVVSRVVRGLAYAHEKCDALGRPIGFVHRDINPHNIMLSFEGDVKLVDFGVAKATLYMTDNEEQVIAGKLDYMSPEQIDFKRTDFRSDVFAVCLVLAEVLAGEKLVRAGSLEEARKRIQTLRAGDLFEARPDAFANPAVRAILEKGLAPEPEGRYAATKDLLVDLERLIYSAGYGPTNESLAEYLRGLFPRREVAGLSPTSPTVIVR